jgi:secreted trypsin-like serine protease
MSSRRLALAVASLIPLLTSCAPDRAAGPLAPPTAPSGIVFGAPDVSNGYSNVAAFIVRAPNGRFAPICTGTLVSPTAVLTAAHCTSYFEAVLAPLGYTAHVSFRNLIAYGAAADAPTIASLIAVTAVITNPGYNQRQSDVGDLAILRIAAAPAGVVSATLPALGLLDELAARNGLKDATFTAVGYGVQDRVVGGGTPSFTDANPRYRGYAVESFLSLNGGFLRLSQNPATGDAGACYGDSGGPNFLSVNGQSVLVAVTITGDAVCRATNVVYRVDTPSARAFLTPNLP